MVLKRIISFSHQAQNQLRSVFGVQATHSRLHVCHSWPFASKTNLGVVGDVNISREFVFSRDNAVINVITSERSLHTEKNGERIDVSKNPCATSDWAPRACVDSEEAGHFESCLPGTFWPLVSSLRMHRKLSTILRCPAPSYPNVNFVGVH